MRVEVSPEAEEFVRGRGGQLWVWVARPWVCCWSTPAYMYAATTPPQDVSEFSPVHTTGLDVWFRAPSGREPGVLEIVLRGRRRPRVEAYWDGCIYALSWAVTRVMARVTAHDDGLRSAAGPDPGQPTR